MPPRTLKAQVGVWFSCFTHTSHPARLARRGQAYCGVDGIVRCTSWAAASNSARLNSGLGALIKNSQQDGQEKLSWVGGAALSRSLPIVLYGPSRRCGLARVPCRILEKTRQPCRTVRSFIVTPRASQ